MSAANIGGLVTTAVRLNSLVCDRPIMSGSVAWQDIIQATTFENRTGKTYISTHGLVDRSPPDVVF